MNGTRLWVRAVHYGIVAVLLLQLAYVGWVFFVVLAPPAGDGPILVGRAADLPLDLLVRRRLYAIEGWVCFGVLAVYLGVTEIVPRLRRA